jgi:hypothetical protein
VEQAQEEQDRSNDEQNFLVSCRQKEGPPPYLRKRCAHCSKRGAENLVAKGVRSIDPCE